MKLLSIAMVLAAGMLFPLQAGINSRLGVILGGPLVASLASFFVGTAALLVWVLAVRVPVNIPAGLAQTSWWHWTGGIIGAYIVACMTLLAPRLGAGAMIALLLSGQLAASMLLDHFGLFGYPVIPIDAKRLLGVAFLAAGVILIRR